MRHSRSASAAACVGAGALLCGATGHAQPLERTSYQRPLAAPTSTFELRVGTGYTEGFGPLTPSQSIPDVAGAGVGADVDVDYRIDPRWSVGLQGEYQAFANDAGVNTAARGLAGNAGVTYHGRPFVHGDPWLRLAAGYRGLWSVNGPAPSGGASPATVLVHGFEAAKATVGWDVRLSPDIAVAPLIGADLDVFAWQEENGVARALSSPQVGTFVFAGLQGRFDLGGGRETASGIVAGR